MSKHPFPKSLRAMTLIEVITMITILGIVLFITLPRLSTAKSTGDISVAKSKAILLLGAKDSFVAIRGITQAQDLWKAATDDNARFLLLKPYISTLNAGVNTLNTTSTTTGFVPLGYIISFNTTLVTAPVKLYTDTDLDYTLDAGEPEIAYY